MVADKGPSEKLAVSDIPRLLVVAMPLALAPGALVALLLDVLGYRDRQTQAVYSVVGVSVATLFISVFEDRLRNPSRSVKIAAATGYLILVVLLWARVSHLLPEGG